MKKNKLWLTFLTGLALTSFGRIAKADLITFEGSISSGTIHRAGPGGGTTGGLNGAVSGPGFGLFFNSRACCIPQQLDAGGTYFITDGTANEFALGGGFFDLNGTHYECSRGFPAPLSECGSSVLIRYGLYLPDLGGPPRLGFPVVVSVPFYAFADFGCGSATECGGPFYLQASGAGIATLTFIYFSASGQPFYSLQDGDYVFTPEPATIILAGVGLLIIGLFYCRGRQFAQKPDPEHKSPS